jgi:prevent-host-death family protein
MSTSVGIRELRQQVSAVLKRVVNGEVIEVTDHGHPIARIVPLRGGSSTNSCSKAVPPRPRVTFWIWWTS